MTGVGGHVGRFKDGVVVVTGVFKEDPDEMFYFVSFGQRASDIEGNPLEKKNPSLEDGKREKSRKKSSKEF